MKLINKKLLLYIITNFCISSLIILLMWYTAGYLSGIQYYIYFVLGAPSFFILVIVMGFNYAMHFAAEETFYVVSFIFYSIIIALIQVVIYMLKTKNTHKT